MRTGAKRSRPWNQPYQLRPSRAPKYRSDGTKILRLVAGMRWPGVHGSVKVRERIVLPRVSDAVNEVLGFLSEWEPYTDPTDIPVEACASGFKYAFYTMRPRPDERRCVALRGISKWHVSLAVTFDIA